MNITKKVETALNKQITMEIHSSHAYLAMAAHFEEKSLNGFGSWYRAQANEEHEHAMKIYNYILERGGSITIDAIPKPAANWKSTLSIAQAALKHEQAVTKSIHDIKLLAQKEKDLATDEFLNWFVSEQVEEEDNASALVDRVKIAGEGHGLLILDQELGKRKD